jgi:hypothetical protein
VEYRDNRNRNKNEITTLLNKKKIPKNAAVVITCINEDFTYAKTLKEASEKISLDELGIEKIVPRRAITGALILEIPGENTNEKAMRLETKLKELFNSTEVSITRPIKKAELKIYGLEDSVTPEDIIEVISREGNCSPRDIKCSNIKETRSGLGAAWLQYPVVTKVNLTKIGQINIGWLTAGIELLRRRPLQYYRCLAVGHPYQKCTSNIDRRNLCYKCGREGHRIRECLNADRCPVCTDRGFKSDHRTGSEKCPPCPSRDFHTGNSRNKNNKNNEEEVNIEMKGDRRPSENMQIQ